MNRHQVLTGACNAGEQCFAVGSVEGVHFTFGHSLVSVTLPDCRTQMVIDQVAKQDCQKGAFYPGPCTFHDQLNCWKFPDQCFRECLPHKRPFLMTYAAGCDIVILASDFQRVQIIPGVAHGNIKVSCIDCSTDTGKIAASYGNKVYIFEPTPLIHHESSHKLDYQWYQTATFEGECHINCLSWSTEGSKLLTGGDVIQMWQLSHEPLDDEPGGKSVQFLLGGQHQDDEDADSVHMRGQTGYHYNEHRYGYESDVEAFWHCVWRCKPASPVHHLKFSPDGLLFSSAGENDRMVKIWYEDRKISYPLTRMDSSFSPKKEEIHYSFIYISHPRAVTGLAWRKTSKYMPKGSVANMMVTSCKDNVCRLWCETVLPDDGLVDLEQFDPNSSGGDMKYHTQRHKKRFIERLKHIRHGINKRKKNSKLGPERVMSLPTFPTLGSVHDFHKFAYHDNGIGPTLHFHLSASINPETDIPLLPILSGRKNKQYNFQLHWLNNKELQFTMEAEKILQELHKRSSLEEQTRDDNQQEFDSEEQEVEPEAYGYQDHSDHEQEHAGKKRKSKLFRKKRKEKKKDKNNLGQHTDSQSSISSDHGEYSQSADGTSADYTNSSDYVLDKKIENLLRDWHQCPDMLFSIHPVDGSFMVWLVDWLDEYAPYCFRQAQVSFSSRLPHAFPIPDARTMSSCIHMYCNYSKMDIKSAMKLSESKSINKTFYEPAPATGKSSPGQNDNMLIPNVLLLSKHENGSLNQWQVSFSDTSKFQTVVSVAHASRACGHRFRTNTAVCHPVLPLLLTSSHHNIPEEESPLDSEPSGPNTALNSEDKANLYGGFAFCSELILWRVDPVGPLSKSGGIVELARINSPELSAFSNVAWVPTLLPSTTLGNYSNSPSALFVASDGKALRLYLSLIDARTLLLDMGSQRKETCSFSTGGTESSGYSPDLHSPSHTPGDLFNIVSVQSSARPGCIIELEPISDACQDWQHIQFIHVFQEQLITGKEIVDDWSNMEAVVDLRNSGTFEENFFLVVLEKNKEGSTLHMWKVTISSNPGGSSEAPHRDYQTQHHYTSDDYIIDDDDEDMSHFAHDPSHNSRQPSAIVRLSISTTKVCSQKMPLPEFSEIVSASPAAGHLSSASIYPACFAPYLFVTACSDGRVRLWKCTTAAITSDSVSKEDQEQSKSLTSFKFSLQEDNTTKPFVTSITQSTIQDTKYDWVEWEMMYQTSGSSAIRVPGRPITVSCAYNGRLAIAYRSGKIRALSDNPENKFVNLCVAIFECESTGGSEWIKEDVIELKNISIPDPRAEIDLNMIFSPDYPSAKPLTVPETDSERKISPSPSFANMTRTKSVPSLSTIQSVKKSIAEQGNKIGFLKQKHLVQLDWVSTEDGSHVLTVGVGSKILMYSLVAEEIVQSSQNITVNHKKSHHEDQGRKRRPPLQKSKSMVIDDTPEEIRWLKLRAVELSTADGLPSLPMHISWVRGGILVAGMDNEMHVYSQWRGLMSLSDNESANIEDVPAPLNKRDVTEMNLTAMLAVPSQMNFKPSVSVPNFKQVPTSLTISSAKKRESTLKNNPRTSMNLTKKSSLSKSESTTSLTLIQDNGLFEAARFANPVLPQYHPKQLMELLNFGKMKRVKAILAHLERCIVGSDNMQAMYVDDPDSEEGRLKGARPRAMSVGAGVDFKDSSVLHEDPSPDYVEITSIPPLPIYALLAADVNIPAVSNDITSPSAMMATQDYTNLFETNVMGDEELDVDVFSSSLESTGGGGRNKLMSSSQSPAVNRNYFGPNQARVLMTHLTRVQLPGLSSLDQMYLMALGDTVANTKTDFGEREAVAEQTKAVPDSGEETGAHIGHLTESMDECGLRFMLAMQHHTYLLSTLPRGQRHKLQKQGLKTFNIVWAFHSEAAEELLSFIPSMQKGEPTWDELRQFGAGWWITNVTVLKRTIEKVAKAAFQANKDPMDAALFYLAMKKKNVLWGLFRSNQSKKMSDFFRNNFEEERWRKAALKNAFALLSRQRFMEAAAFFLLADSLIDAIEVCLDKLNDLQLAIVVCRLYDGEDAMPESIKKLLYNYILGCDKNGNNYVPERAHPDPFVRSMAFWMLKDYIGALRTLLHTDLGHENDLEDHNDSDTSATPNVFNFYNYLRTHPLLIRQRLAADGKQNVVTTSDKGTIYVDHITPMERRLFFQTAHTHFKNGCPMLALEVLSRLPEVTELDEEEENRVGILGGDVKQNIESNGCVHTGTISGFMNEEDVLPRSNAVQEASAVDWGQPLTNGISEGAENFDWGNPVSKMDDDEFKLDWESDTNSADEDLEATDVSKPKHSEEAVTNHKPDIPVENSIGAMENQSLNISSRRRKTFDVMAQQYKFVACLKILMEELGTLATGFEVDGGQLRYQLYVWLEKEVDALKSLCNYGETEEEYVQNGPIRDESLDMDDTLDIPRLQRSLSIRSDASCIKPTLHEVILAEKLDLEAKLDRMSKRKQWLKSNHHLLRTLVSYCVIQGSGGGGLASVRMELLLLLQELTQERPQQQLASPLPFPTTLPLLSASIASSKTVVADPIQHLQSLTQDLLHSVIEFTTPPGTGDNLHTVFLMRDLSMALSSCIYQCLCDSDNFVVAMNEKLDVGWEGFSCPSFVIQGSHLMAGARRKRPRNDSDDGIISTSPAKWPGVQSLRVWLAREKDNDAPKLSILLCETLIAVYSSLLINGLATYDPYMLFRIVAHKINQQTWAALFGGGVKTVLKVSAGNNVTTSTPSDNLSKQRMKLNMKVMGKIYEGKQTYKEKFLPPELSMATYFMTKPFVSASEAVCVYDSDDSLSSDEEELYEFDEEDGLGRPKTLSTTATCQHTDPNSYSWCLIRYAIVHLVIHNLRTFLPEVGIELPDLPVCSPLMHTVLKTLELWEEILEGKLNLFSGAPDDFIPGLYVDVLDDVPLSRYKALLDPSNSPFIDQKATMPLRRLWFHLVQEDYLKETFVRYIYRKKKIPNDEDSTRCSVGNDSVDGPVMEPIKIIHKEQDIICAFANNQTTITSRQEHDSEKANVNLIALSTQKEVVELDIGALLNPPSWLYDENEYAIESIKNPTPTPLSTDGVDFMVVQTPFDNNQNTTISGTATPATPQIGGLPGSVSTQSLPYQQTGRGTSVVKGLNRAGNSPFSLVIMDRSRRLMRTMLRRQIPGVRRIASHPLLPHYLTGSADGSVRLWEWGHSQPLSVLRQPGSFPKVTKVLFNAQGNKSCVSDIEGSICLWQVGLASSFNKPIMSLQCHNKTTSDLVFIGSSSLIATAGHSSESKNVCLWDTLLPQRSACVHAFTCHEHGSPALVFAPQHQLLISGGRKGEICIFDIRQRQIRHTFQAHDGPIKCLAIDPDEDYFVTGSAEGDIKVWGLDVHQQIYTFQGEHSKSTFFRTVGSTAGVTQVTIGPNHNLFSCGVDGSMKMRALPERETAHFVHHWPM